MSKIAIRTIFLIITMTFFIFSIKIGEYVAYLQLPILLSAIIIAMMIVPIVYFVFTPIAKWVIKDMDTWP